MNLDEAKDVLEAIGIADSVTDEIVEASTVVLDALEAASSTKKIVVPQPQETQDQENYVEAWLRRQEQRNAVTQNAIFNDTTEVPIGCDLQYDYEETL